ncbi:MAG: hypothetical protein HC889_00525 [Synechococcaceae cyanobacterium SM1_2_3]|nr:hypothetical protein [Synechococcaceae cyanobacterium SM1_2_3]
MNFRPGGKPDVFVWVYRLPVKLANGFAFTPKPITFWNVDWFEVPEDRQTREAIAAFVRSRAYFRTEAAYLILAAERPDLTFTLGTIKR